VLSNSVLIASLILQEALNASSLSWRAVVYDSVEGVRKFLICAAHTHSSRHRVNVLKSSNPESGCSEWHMRSLSQFCQMPSNRLYP
jgi:hypothetical protein